MAYDRLRQKYGYPPGMSDTDVVRTTRSRPEFAQQSDEDFASGVDAYESGGAVSSGAEAEPAPPAAATQRPRIPSGGPMGLIPAAQNVSQQIAERGGMKYLAGTPGRAAREATDILRGIGPLMAGGLHVASLPHRALGLSPNPADQAIAQEELSRAGSAFSRAAPQFLSELGQQSKEYATNPMGAALERPVQTSLDALMLAGLPSSAAGGAARGAAAIGARGAAKGLARVSEAARPSAVAMQGFRAAEEASPLIKRMAERSRQIGGTRDIVAEQMKRRAAGTEEFSEGAREAMGGLAPPTRRFVAQSPFEEGQLRWPVRAVHTKAGEAETMTPVLQGLASLRPEYQTPEIQKALEFARSQIGQETEELIGAGRLKPETADLRRFQPLRMVTGGEDQIAREGAARRMLSGVVPATERLKAQTADIRTRFPGIDPTYVPMIPPRGERATKSLISMMPASFRTTVSRPGFLRRSTGERALTGKFEKNFPMALTMHKDAMLGYKMMVGILDDVTKNPKLARPIKSFEDVDWTNEVLIAPEQFTKNVGAGIAQGEDAIKAAIQSGDMEGSLSKAALGTIEKDAAKATATPGRLYAIPGTVAKELEGQLRGRSNAFAQIFFDSPNNYLRWSALTLRPGFYVNNLIGGVGLSALSGTSPRSFVEAGKPSVRASMPTSIRGAGFAQVEAPAQGIGSGRWRDLKALPHELNQGVDDWTRAAGFHSEVERRAAKKLLLEEGKLMDRAMTFEGKMDFIGPEGVKDAVRHVNLFLNDYARQAPFQKRYLRRFLPFQSFLVHMGKLTAKLPLMHPMRANLVSKASELANEYQKEQFRESGIEPEDVAAFRWGQLPVRDTEEGTVTLGTGGLNPASGLGAAQGEMVQDPGLVALARGLAGQLGIGPSLALQIITHENAIGMPLTSPTRQPDFPSGKYYEYDPTTEESRPVGAPVPSPMDVIRQATPAIGLAERALQPEETYMLTGSQLPWDPNYLPSTDKGEPRKYGFSESLAQYFGFPYRDFTQEELEISKSERQARKRSAKKARKREEESQ